MPAWVAGLYDVERRPRRRVRSTPSGTTRPWNAYRHNLRSRPSRPLLETIHTWLVAEQPKVLPKSPIGAAIGYALNHWRALIRPWQAGFLEIDNGAGERALKRAAPGRMRWLFAGSDEGARRRRC